MKLDLDKLEAIANKAKQGEWEWEVHDDSMASLVVSQGDPLENHVLSVSPCRHCASREGASFFGRCTLPSDADAAFIEAFNPKVVLELISLVKLAKEE